MKLTLDVKILFILFTRFLAWGWLKGIVNLRIVGFRDIAFASDGIRRNAVKMNFEQHFRDMTMQWYDIDFLVGYVNYFQKTNWFLAEVEGYRSIW